MAVLSKVQRYKEGELDLDVLARKAQFVLNKKPFLWQLEVAEAILCGEDVIVDVGTGSGKTLCFTLPLLADGAQDDIVLTVSPLTALMIDQVCISPIYSTVIYLGVGEYITAAHSCRVCRSHCQGWAGTGLQGEFN